ncbi:hypothetical protein EON81_13360 [bacterium]|nr:MAG: hypothetical protein EON81_13360 [bacterium]
MQTIWADRRRLPLPRIEYICSVIVAAGLFPGVNSLAYRLGLIQWFPLFFFVAAFAAIAILMWPLSKAGVEKGAWWKWNVAGIVLGALPIFLTGVVYGFRGQMPGQSSIFVAGGVSVYTCLWFSSRPVAEALVQASPEPSPI